MNVADRVQETTNATSMATISLAGASQYMRRFSAAFAVGSTGIPVSVDDGAGNWESGAYTLSGTSTLTRTKIYESSNSGNAVTFPAGAKSVTCAPCAKWFDEFAAEILDGVESATGGVNPNDAGFDIILLAGQSNMAGRGSLDTSVDVGDPRISQFGGTSGQTLYRSIFNGADPLHMPEKVESGILGPATWAARAYSTTIPTNRRILLVPAAWGGTGMVASSARWNPSTPGDLYENAISQANLAITAAQAWYPNSRFVGTFWIQGESDGDANVGRAAYLATLTALVSGFRSRITGAANSWFVIGSMVPEAIAASNGYAQVDLAHKDAAEQIARCAFAPGVAGRTSDNLHYNAAGARIMGSRLGLSVALATGAGRPVVSPGQVTNLAAGTVTNTTIPLTWSAPSTGDVPTDYIVEYKRAADSSWVTFADGVSSTTGTTVTGLTINTSYNFRVAANNSTGTGPVSATLTASTANVVATAPGAPTIGTATAGISSATVNGTAPASNGGQPITSYTATSSPGGLTGTAATLPVTVNGLTAGTAYTFTLTATNSVGTGPASAASNSVTPQGAITAYTFENDTLGQPPSGITVLGGAMEVVNSGVAAWTGKYAHFTGGAAAGNVYAATLDAIPSTTDRTVTWRRGVSTAKQARDGITLRATNGSVTGYGSARRGYYFQTSGQTDDLRLYRFDAAGATQLGASFSLSDGNRYYRASAIGTTIKLEYSADGTTWNTAISATDSTYPSGGVDYCNGFNGTNLSTAHIDDVNWS